ESVTTTVSEADRPKVDDVEEESETPIISDSMSWMRFAPSIKRASLIITASDRPMPNVISPLWLSSAPTESESEILMSRPARLETRLQTMSHVVSQVSRHRIPSLEGDPRRERPGICWVSDLRRREENSRFARGHRQGQVPRDAIRIRRCWAQVDGKARVELAARRGLLKNTLLRCRHPTRSGPKDSNLNLVR